MKTYTFSFSEEFAKDLLDVHNIDIEKEFTECIINNFTREWSSEWGGVMLKFKMTSLFNENNEFKMNIEKEY